MKLNKIIVSENSFNSNDPYDLINSNITVINLLREEGIDDENIHEDSLTSYYLDYYLAQYNNGNFSQFVWNTQWLPELNEIIKKGLKQIGANEHLNLFTLQCSIVEELTTEELNEYLLSEYFGENSTRDKLKNDSFYSIDESIIDLNSKWLRNHPKIQVLSIDDMFLELEKFIGRKIER
jgi:hypothetical protein